MSNVGEVMGRYYAAAPGAPYFEGPHPWQPAVWLHDYDRGYVGDDLWEDRHYANCHPA